MSNKDTIIYSIRTARDDDLSDVKNLLTECELPLDGLENYFGEPYCLVIQNDTVIGVGGVEIYKKVGLLRSVAVSPAVQGHSIGKIIVDNRIAYARLKGVKTAYLLTTSADKFFQRSGFEYENKKDAPEAIKNSVEFLSACPDSAIFMKLEIPD